MRKPVPKPVTPDPAERMERLARISTFFTTERDEAVSARRDTGIEKVWQQAEEVTSRWRSGEITEEEWIAERDRIASEAGK